MKKLIAAASTVFIAVALSVVAVAAPASAHTAHLTGVASCNAADGSATVTWTIDNDYNEVLNVTASDNTAIPVGTTVAATGGGADTVKKFTQTIAAPAAGKSASATVSFLWSGDGFTQTGTTANSNTVSPYCSTPTPKDAAAVLTVTPATCAAAATVAEGSTTFASWQGDIVFSGAGKLHYSASAKANVGHQFPDGSNRLTLSGDLQPKLSGIDCEPPVCIPASAVTYHYNANDHNDGYITVKDVPHSTGALCDPFYVTATSWKFTTNSSVWPQTRDVVDKLGKISAPGTYTFAARVTCGQGDIYASFDSTAPSLNPGLVLNGPSNPFAEHFLSDMGFKGSASPTYTQDAASCFVPVVTTGTPTSTVLSCTPYSANSLTLPAVPGGVWKVTSASYSHTYAMGTGITGFVPTVFEKYTIVLSDGSSSDGYAVTGNTSTWTPVDASSLDCNTVATPVSPTVDPIDKCGVYGSITIPTNTPGVVYTLGDVVEPAGTVVTGLSGSQTIVATPDKGYEFADKSKSVTYNLDLGTYQTCDITVTDPSFAQPTCTGDDSPNDGSVSVLSNSNVKYTLTGTGITGEDFPTSAIDGTTETIGGLSAGQYTVTATGLNGHTINGQTVYSFSIITLDSPNCVVDAPSISWTPASCTPDAAQVENAGFVADATEVQGSITLPADSHVTYRIDGTIEAAGTYGNLADGVHTVTATLTAGQIAAGATFAESTAYTLNAAKTVATWTVTFTAGCLPTLPVWHDGASSTDALCTTTGPLGTITVTHLDSEAGKVSYSVENDSTHHVTNLGTSVSTIKVAPGHYTVTAAVAPGDGVVGDQLVFHLTVAAAAAICGDTSLAFTGGTIAWAGFALAGGMLFLGIAFLFIRRRNQRTAQ